MMFKLLIVSFCFLQVQIYGALLANFSQGGPVYGVVDDKKNNIYVIHESQPTINVYKLDKFALKLNASLPTLGGPYDAVYSKTADSLFLLDWTRSEDVLRVHLDRRFDSSTWKFTSEFTSASLSVTPSQNVIITMTKSATFGEYNASGGLVKLVALKNITEPRQVVKMTNNRYAVCFGYDANKTHGVCIVDGQGKTVKCLQGPPGNSSKQFNVPARMIVTGKGSLLVADMKNHRIVELPSDLSRVKVVLSAADGLTQPYRMDLYDNKNILFVANNQLDPATGYAVSGHVLVFDYKP